MGIHDARSTASVQPSSSIPLIVLLACHPPSHLTSPSCIYSPSCFTLRNCYVCWCKQYAFCPTLSLISTVPSDHCLSGTFYKSATVLELVSHKSKLATREPGSNLTTKGFGHFVHLLANGWHQRPPLSTSALRDNLIHSSPPTIGQSTWAASCNRVGGYELYPCAPCFRFSIYSLLIFM